MNCQDFWKNEPGVLEHLEECPSCAARYARHEQIGAALRELGAGLRHVGAPGRVERRLVSAYRGQAAFTEVPRRTSWIPLVTWATALAATVLAGFVLIRPHRPQQNHGISGGTVELAVAEAPEPLDQIAGWADGYSEFIPLPNAESIAPNEQVNLVRVEIPRSAMIPLGYAVSEENASETVEADVVLGADGLARAVRFLNQSTSF
jgi:hypothetical protein